MTALIDWLTNYGQVIPKDLGRHLVLSSDARSLRRQVQAFVRRYVTGKPQVTGVLVSPEDRPALGALAEARA